MINFEQPIINNILVPVDISSLVKSDELFFNATNIAKQFDKRPDDFWKQSQNTDYLLALVTLSQGSEKSDFIKTKVGGKYQGTWLHNDLALQFARWCDATFAVLLDRWIVNRVNQEHVRKQARLEAKTGFLPMTNAVNDAHSDPKSYHFSNESNLIYLIVLGMTAKKYKETYGVDSVRDNVLSYELTEIGRLQTINTGLIAIGMDYQNRKQHLIACHEATKLKEVS